MYTSATRVYTAFLQTASLGGVNRVADESKWNFTTKQLNQTNVGRIDVCLSQQACMVCYVANNKLIEAPDQHQLKMASSRSTVNFCSGHMQVKKLVLYLCVAAWLAIFFVSGKLFLRRREESSILQVSKTIYFSIPIWVHGLVFKNTI